MHEEGLKTKKQIISVLFLVIIMVATFWFYLKGYSYHQLFSALKSANYAYLIAGLGMVLVFVVCEAVNIYLIMRVLGQNVPFKRCFEYSCIGFYFSSITPSASGGQPAQIYYMKKDNIPITLSSITIFYTIFVYQIVMIMLGIAAVILSYHTAVQFIIKLKYLLIIGTFINTGAIFLMFSFMFSKKILPRILFFFVGIGKKLRIVKQENEIKADLEKSMVSYHEKASVIKLHPILFIKVLFVTLIQMIALYLIPYLVYKSMGNSANNLIDMLSCQSLLTIAVSAIPLPGAEGVTQGGFLQVFDMFFSRNSIACAMLIHRAISFYIPLVLSFIAYIFTHLRTTKQLGIKDVVEKCPDQHYTLYHKYKSGNSHKIKDRLLSKSKRQITFTKRRIDNFYFEK